MQKLTISPEKEREIVHHMNQKSDKIMLRFLLIYSFFGIGISFYYDTWIIGFSIAGLCIACWYIIKSLMPNADLHRYVASAFLGVFVGTFIYQMHGLFEMHFFAFIGSAALIVYQNWKLQIPLIVVVLGHHAVFGFMQYSGVPDIYFTQLQYMDLQTFLYHGSLATAVVIVCGYWAFRFRRMTTEEAVKSHALSVSMEEMKTINETLDQMVLDRTRELENKNLQLTGYAFINSHLLRAPLANIIGLSEMLAHEMKGKIENKELLEKFQISCHELDQVIRLLGEYLSKESVYSPHQLNSFQNRIVEIAKEIKEMV